MLNVILACFAQYLLLIQRDFQSHKCEIEEFITLFANGKHHLVIYYPKYYCELNHIEQFRFSAKKLDRENCQHTLKDLS